MRGFRVGVDGVEEVDVDPAALLADEISWDCVSFDEAHELWADDQGLLKPSLRVADIGSLRNIPLPVFILGADGEDSADATFSLDQMRSMVRMEGPTWTPEAGHPMLGMDVKFDFDGGLHGWRAVLAFPKEMMHSREFLMRLPKGLACHGGTHDRDHGELTELPIEPAQQADAIAAIRSRRSAATVLMNRTDARTGFPQLLEERGVIVKLMEVLFIPDEQMDNSFDIGGEAGHEICQLADPGLTERIKVSEERRRLLIERRRLVGSPPAS